MVLTKKQLRNIIKEAFLVENTKDLETDVLTYLTSKDNSDFFSKNLGISKKIIPVLAHVAIAITGRESSFGDGKKYLATNWGETAASELSHVTGVDFTLRDLGNLVGVEDLPDVGVTNYSVGAGQIKYPSAVETLSPDVMKKIGINSPSDLSDDFKAIITIFAMLAKSYNKAKSLGYSTRSPGSIKGATAHQNAKKIFISTGNAALDISIVAHNSGEGKIKKYPQGRNYIPCYGSYCTNGSSGTATYGYVKDISNYLSNKGITATE